MAQSASSTLQTGRLQLLQPPGHPLSAMIAAWAVRLIGTTDPVRSVNLMSVILGSFVVLIFFAFLKQLFDEPTALIASLLLSPSPIFLGTSLYGNSHMNTLIFLLSGMFFLSKYAAEQKPKYLWICGLLFGLTGASRVQDLIAMTIPIAAGFLLLPDEFSQLMGHPPSWKKRLIDGLVCIMMAWLITAIFYFPLISEFVQSPWVSQLGAFSVHTKTQIQSDYLRLIRLGIKYYYENFLFIGIVTLVAGAIYLLRIRTKTNLFITIWIIIPFLIFSTLDIITPRIYLVSIIPLYIFPAALLARLCRQAKGKLMTIIILLILIALPFAKYYSVFKFRHDFALLPEFVRWLERKTEPSAVIIAGDEKHFIHYYSKLATLDRPRHATRPFSTKELQEFKARLDALLNKNIPVYGTGPGLYADNYKNQFSNFLEQEYAVSPIGRKYYEDWHRGELTQFIIMQSIYKIGFKNRL